MDHYLPPFLSDFFIFKSELETHSTLSEEESLLSDLIYYYPSSTPLNEQLKWLGVLKATQSLSSQFQGKASIRPLLAPYYHVHSLKKLVSALQVAPGIYFTIASIFSLALISPHTCIHTISLMGLYELGYSIAIASSIR